MGKKDKGNAQAHEGDADQAGQDAAVAEEQAGQEPVAAADGEDGEDFAKDHPADVANVLDQRTASGNEQSNHPADIASNAGATADAGEVSHEKTVGETTAAVDGEGAAAGTEAAAGIDAATETAEGNPVPVGAADAGPASVGGDDGAGGGRDADAGAALDPDGNPGSDGAPADGDPMETLNETDGIDAPVELDVRGDPLLTLDDVLEQAAIVLTPALQKFMLIKPNRLMIDMHPPAKGEQNPAKVLAEFYMQNPDAPLQAGFQQLRLKGFGSLAGAETNMAALWQFKVFRAVIDGGLEFMRAEQKELADALAAGKKPETWGGATGFKPEPGPFEATGFTAE